GEVGAAAAGLHDERPADLPQDRDGRRPPGAERALRRVEGRGLRLRVHARRPRPDLSGAGAEARPARRPRTAQPWPGTTRYASYTLSIPRRVESSASRWFGSPSSNSKRIFEIRSAPVFVKAL